jgi:hypothetical protein
MKNHISQEINQGLYSFLNASALSLIIGGFIYIAVQFVHPPDTLASVLTLRWILVGALTSIMSFLICLGVFGVFLIHLKNFGSFAKASSIVFLIFWILSMIFSFIEAFVLPLLVTSAPDFTKDMLGLFQNSPATTSLGVFPSLVTLSGLMYILGGIGYGIGIYKATLFPKSSGMFIALASSLTLGAAVVPHPYDRIFAIPMGLSLIFIGFSTLKLTKNFLKADAT